MKKRTSPNGKKADTVVFNIRIDRDVLECLKDMAAIEHRTVTNMVQVILLKAVHPSTAPDVGI